jgi:hypothetical protein
VAFGPVSAFADTYHLSELKCLVFQIVYLMFCIPYDTIAMFPLAPSDNRRERKEGGLKMAIESTDPVKISSDPTTMDSAAKRKAAATRRFVEHLNASSPGITPRMQEAIETYKRVKAERVKA